MFNVQFSVIIGFIRIVTKKKMLQADLKPREFMENLKRDNHDPSLLFKKEGATTIENIDDNTSKK